MVATEMLDLRCNENGLSRFADGVTIRLGCVAVMASQDEFAYTSNPSDD
jgi:hypothetical protein